MESKIADYPEHPDSIIISKGESLSGKEYQEKDVWSYYEGVKDEILKEIKGRNVFIRLKSKSGSVFIRHPFTGKGEYISINNDKQFDEYHTGRIVEFHVTMPAACPYYIVDFDAVGDWDKTKKVTAEIADGLGKLPEVSKVEIRYSGKRGFHVLGWLKKSKPIDQAREDLKAWLKGAFGDRDDLVVGESPKGSKGALGVSPMKLNGGQVALWSLRITGLCCVEVPRAKLLSFNKEDASLEKTYKNLTGKTFMSVEKKVQAGRVVNSFLELDAGYGTNVVDPMSSRPRILQVRAPKDKQPLPSNPHMPFAEKGETVTLIYSDGTEKKVKWDEKLEKAIKESGC